jgi:hypothetical protein
VCTKGKQQLNRRILPLKLALKIYKRRTIAIRV